MNTSWDCPYDLENSDISYPPVGNEVNSNRGQISCVEKSDFPGSNQRKDNNKPFSPSPSSEPRMRTMVRHGEYSPLNPNFLSPGKFMLGLGEYEERRRLLMIQKKHEYKEYLSQVRVLVNSRNGNPTSTQVGHSDTKQKSQEPFNKDKYIEVSNNSKSIQVSKDLPYTLGHQNLPDTAIITTQHKGIQTPIEEPFFQECAQNVGNYAENQVELKLSTLEANCTQHQGDRPHSTLAENLSPRERKLADLQVSEQLSKMFFETTQETNPAQISGTDFQARRQSHSAIYKEELRQQIEDKRKLDFELREKEKREEEVINRRVEEQQEKIRLEFLKEETKKLEKQKQRLSGLEEYPDEQQRAMRCIKPSHEVEISRQISNLEECYPDNLHEHPILLPEINATHSSSSVQPEPQLNDGSRQSLKTNANHIKKHHIIHEVSNSVKFPPTLPFRSKSFTVIDSTISNDSTFLKSAVDGDSNRLWKPTDRNAQVRSCKTCNLEDSLPIPLFRSTSPVNLPVETSATGPNKQSKAVNNRITEGSQAMKKLEAKWQVPAVEKNNITRTTHQVPGGSRQKNVLTQLGAFRRQLQLEQMQTSEGLQKVKPQKILK